MKVLVTGSTGFIGTQLLANEGLMRHEVICPVRSQPRCERHIRYLPIADFDQSTDWSAALSDCDAVIHLAGRAHVLREAASDPLAEFRRINVGGTLHLARQAARHGVRRFIFVSSVKVNGEQTFSLPFGPMDPPAPQDPYGMSKFEAECGLRDLASDGMEVTIIRPPLVYGPGVKANFLRLMQSVRRGIPLPFGAVDNRRSMVYVGNLVDLLLTCLTHPQAANRVFMVSDNEDLSTPALIRLLAEALHTEPRLFNIPPALLQQLANLVGKKAQAEKLLGSLQVDISETLRQLDWRPPFSVRQGLAVTARSLDDDVPIHDY